MSTMITGNNIERFAIAQQASILKIHRSGMKVSGGCLPRVKSFLKARGYETGRSASSVADVLRGYAQDFEISHYDHTDKAHDSLLAGKNVMCHLKVLNEDLDSVKIKVVFGYTPTTKEMKVHKVISETENGANIQLIGIYDITL